MGKVSGDMDGVAEVVGNGREERDDEVVAEGVGNADEGVESVAGACAFIEAGDDGLGGTHALGELPTTAACTSTAGFGEWGSRCSGSGSFGARRDRH